MNAILIVKNYWRVALFLICFLSGWWVNGWRWEAKYANQLEKARKNEQSLQASVDAITNQSAEKSRHIADELNIALDRLRRRPERQPEAADAEQHRQGAIACYDYADKIQDGTK